MHCLLENLSCTSKYLGAGSCYEDIGTALDLENAINIRANVDGENGLPQQRLRPPS